MPDKKTTILIVDDDKFLLDMYATKFLEQHFSVATALSAQDALVQLEKGEVRPDVVLTDILMPTIDGFDFLKRIRDKKMCEGAALVILSNLGEEDDIKKAEEIGVDGYIIKASATPSEAVARVREIVERKG